MLWEIKTVEKKNVLQQTTFVVPSDSEIAAGKTFYMTEWYRWGRCVVRSNEKPTYNESVAYQIPFELGKYDIMDQECDDGCSLDFTFEDTDDWTEEERQYIHDTWEEDGWLSFEEHGIESYDCDTDYYGPLEITCIDDAPEEPKPTPKSTWPF